MVYHQRRNSASVAVIINAASKTSRVIAINRAIYDRQPRVIIVDASAAIIREIAAGVTISDGQAGNGDVSGEMADVKNAVFSITVDSQVLRSWP